MSLSRIVNRIYDKVDDLASDIIYEKDEDLFMRYARKQETKELRRPAITFVPGMFAYSQIKSARNNEEFKTVSRGGKITVISTIIAGELMLDAVRGGSVYIWYKLFEYFN